jgi:NADPH:quinone reductase-like Zn-dependent oxidoreductase
VGRYPLTINDFFVNSSFGRQRNGIQCEVSVSKVRAPQFQMLKGMSHAWPSPEPRSEFASEIRRASAAVLETLTPFFEDGAFQAPVIDRVIPLSDGFSAYAQVARGEARGRIVLAP